MKAAFKSSHTRERVLFFKFGDLTFKVLNDLCWLGMSTRALHTRFLCVLPVQMSCRCYQSYKVLCVIAYKTAIPVYVVKCDSRHRTERLLSVDCSTAVLCWILT